MIKIVKAIAMAAIVIIGVRIAFLNFAVLSLIFSKISASLWYDSEILPVLSPRFVIAKAT